MAELRAWKNEMNAHRGKMEGQEPREIGIKVDIKRWRP
jgi:hypothetical protein